MFYVNEESIDQFTHISLRSLIGSGTAFETLDKIRFELRCRILT